MVYPNNSFLEPPHIFFFTFIVNAYTRTIEYRMQARIKLPLSMARLRVFSILHAEYDANFCHEWHHQSSKKSILPCRLKALQISQVGCELCATSVNRLNTSHSTNNLFMRGQIETLFPISAQWCATLN